MPIIRYLDRRQSARIVVIAVLIAVAWGVIGPWLVSLAYNNYGSLRLNRALLATGPMAQAKQADSAGAGAAFQSALAWMPGNGLAYYNLGAIYSAWGQPGTAAEAFSRAVTELPWDVSAHFQLGQAYAASGREDLARPEWNQARAAPFFVTQSRAQLAQDDSRAARRSLEIALELEPGLPEVHYALGRLYADEGKIAQAIQSVQAGLGRDHSPIGQWVARAQIAILQQDWPAVLKYYQQAQSVEPGNPALAIKIGQTYADLGRTEQAAAYFRQAIQLDPDYLPAYASLVGLYAQTGNCPLAEDDLEQTPALRQTDDRVAELEGTVAVCWIKANQPARAVPLLERAVSRKPDGVGYRLNLAQAYAAGGRFQDAIREYRAVLQLDPNNARARADLQGLNASEK